MNSSSSLRLNARILMQTPPCLMQLRNSLVYDITLRVGEFWNHMSADDASKTSCPKGIIKSKNQQDFFLCDAWIIWGKNDAGHFWKWNVQTCRCFIFTIINGGSYKWWCSKGWLLGKSFCTSYLWVTLNRREQPGVVLPRILENLELTLYFIDIQAYKFLTIMQHVKLVSEFLNF